MNGIYLVEELDKEQLLLLRSCMQYEGAAQPLMALIRSLTLLYAISDGEVDEALELLSQRDLHDAELDIEKIRRYEHKCIGVEHDCACDLCYEEEEPQGDVAWLQPIAGMFASRNEWQEEDESLPFDSPVCEECTAELKSGRCIDDNDGSDPNWYVGEQAEIFTGDCACDYCVYLRQKDDLDEELRIRAETLKTLEEILQLAQETFGTL